MFLKKNELQVGQIVLQGTSATTLYTLFHRNKIARLDILQQLHSIESEII